MVAQLPEGLPRPVARDIPWLAWTAARAWGFPGSDGWAGRLARAGAACLTIQVWVPYLTSAHVGGGLVAIDRSALAIVSVVGRRQVRGRLVLCILMILSTLLTAAFGLALMIGAAVAAIAVGQRHAVSYLSWIAFLPVLVPVAQVVQMIRTSPVRGGPLGWRRTHRGHLMITCLAAWPHRQGHAGRLERSLGPVLAGDGRPLFAGARTPELARLYRRWADQYPGIQCVVAFADRDGHPPREPQRAVDDRRVAGS